MRKFYNLAGILSLLDEEPLDDEDDYPDDDGRFGTWA